MPSRSLCDLFFEQYELLVNLGETLDAFEKYIQESLFIFS